MPLTREQTKYTSTNSTVFLPTLAIDKNLAVRGSSVFDGSAVFNTGLTVNKTRALFGGILDEYAIVNGIHAGLGASDQTPRIMFVPPGQSTSVNNWQIDVASGVFRWFTPGVLQMTLTPSTGVGSTLGSIYRVTANGPITGTTPNDGGSTGGLIIRGPAGGSQPNAYLQFVNNANNTQWAAFMVDSASNITLTGNLVQNVNATAKTAAYQLTTADANTIIQMNGAFNFTVDTSLAVLPLGTTITLVAQTAGVAVATTATATVPTINATPGLKLRTAWSTASLIKMSAASASGTASTWLLTGDLTA